MGELVCTMLLPQVPPRAPPWLGARSNIGAHLASLLIGAENYPKGDGASFAPSVEDLPVSLAFGDLLTCAVLLRP